MTIRYDCDGPDCEKRMGREDARLAITVEKGSQPVQVWDPADDGPLPEIEIETNFAFYSDGDFHFCSDSCLTSWAMARALDEQDST